jgi:pyridine nucleotide-disulfide oxidoreductase domain-containing protein 1
MLRQAIRDYSIENPQHMRILIHTNRLTNGRQQQPNTHTHKYITMSETNPSTSLPRRTHTHRRRQRNSTQQPQPQQQQLQHTLPTPDETITSSSSSSSSSSLSSSVTKRESSGRKYVIIGGGIAGVTCAAALSQLCSPHAGNSVSILTCSPILKVVRNEKRLTRYLQDFQVCELDISHSHALSDNTTSTTSESESKQSSGTATSTDSRRHRHVRVREIVRSEVGDVDVIHTSVDRVDTVNKIVYTQDGGEWPYDRLAIASGARPTSIDVDNPYVISIRDTESIQVLDERLSYARRVMIVGNGGIALEIVFALRKYALTWVMKDNYLGNTFLDRASSAFVVPFLFPDHDPDVHMGNDGDDNDDTPLQNPQTLVDVDMDTNHSTDAVDDSKSAATTTSTSTRSHAQARAVKNKRGGALGPTWVQTIKAAQHKLASKTTDFQPELNLEMNATVTHCEINPNVKHDSYNNGGSDEFPLKVTLSNGSVHEVDLIVSATGVQPNTEFLGPEFARGPDGGITIGEDMCTSVKDVYAAGDVTWCDFGQKENWFQMRLWTQAKTMGHYCARAMADDVDELGFFFDIFAHSTMFFGRKVVLLGRFNGQGIGQEGVDYSVMVRCKPGEEFIKLVIGTNGALRGAVLIGELELAVC